MVGATPTTVTHSGRRRAWRLRAVGGQLDPPPERIVAAEIHRREPLVDDGGVVAGGAVELVEGATAQQLDPDRLEVARPDGNLGDHRRLLALLDVLAVHRQQAREAAAERHVWR